MHNRLGRQFIDMPLVGRGLDRAMAAVFRSALLGILSDLTCQKGGASQEPCCWPIGPENRRKGHI
jgi:hypothetical protein